MTLSPDKLKRKDSFRKFIPARVKNIFIAAISSKFLAKVISRIFNDRIPHQLGTRIYTRSERISSKTIISILFGFYERAEIDQIKTYLDNSLPVIELGSSIGVGTLQILLRQPTNRCICVEADPELFSILKYNIHYNFGETDRVTLLNNVIDYSGEHTVQFQPSVDNLSGHIRSPSSNDSPANFTQCVPTSTLSHILEQYNIDKFNLVIDIEGAETGLIVADQVALRRCHRIMGEFDGGIFEDKAYSISDLLEILSNLGFIVLHQHGNRISLQNTAIT